MNNLNSVKRFSFPSVAGFNNRRGTAFLTAMFFLVVLLGLGTVFVETSIQEVARASRIRKETRALSLAEAGLDYTAWQIYNQNPTSLPFTLTRSFPEGSFSAVTDHYVDASGTIFANTLQITSTGVSQGFTAEVKAVGQYMTSTGTNNAVFDSALFSNTDLTIEGSPLIDGDIFCNGNLNIKSASATITGKGVAGGKITDKHGRIQGDKIQYAPKQGMPVVDLQYYRANATTYYSGDYTFSSPILMDGITYVDGAVHLSGQVSGKGVIVCTGEVQINGNVTLASSDAEFAVISVSNVRINGTCQIDGVIYSHNADIPTVLIGNGTATVNGAIVTDYINMKGTIDVTYKKPTVPLPGNDSSPIQLDVVSWRRVK